VQPWNTAERLHARCVQVNPSIKKEKWTEDEDGRLAALVGEHGNAWAEIARRMAGRTDQQCMGRWRRHLDPAIRRDAWAARCACARHPCLHLPHQHARVLHAPCMLSIAGPTVSRGQEHVRTRAGAKMPHQWQAALQSAIALLCQIWRREDVALAALYRKHGSQWSSISKHIDGRTAQQCRARRAVPCLPSFRHASPAALTSRNTLLPALRSGQRSGMKAGLSPAWHWAWGKVKCVCRLAG
jgi:hypothetical protein